MAASAEYQRDLSAKHREKALWVSCLVCDALPGDECIRTAGVAEGEMHQERIKAAKDIAKLERSGKL